MTFFGRHRSDPEPVAPITNLGTCAHCRQRDATTRLRRIGGLGLRPLCDRCCDALTPLYRDQLERDPAIRRPVQ